ncbi:DMT family transporter [Sphingomonas abietis]|uniref:DMT family transporter n=1 Tax=Sphingomonas abietis TaxID=3012344 RepID=A0ABY7NSI8_9SPHN|nr:DMT family transporter [Sphingomonas abietis]WBO23608.1 DMT family transporter [Sphingomonas abietis]
MFAAAAPILFVLIWSTGFIVARAVIPFVSPELFLTARLLLTVLLLGTAAAVAREALPRGRRLGLHLTAGAMLHGFYLCMSWWAVGRGMPAGIMSLLGSLQPLMVAVASFGLFGERLAARSWAGLGVAIAGVGCVLAPTLMKSGVGSVDVWGAIAAVVAVLGMTAGTMIQRGALSSDPIRISGAVQNAGGAVVAIVATLAIGQYHWDNRPILWIGLAWSVLALSAAGLSLLVWMVRHQGATRVSSLLLLVPMLAAIEAWALFGETLGPIQITGFVLALGGVLLARARPKAPIPEPA